MLFTYALGLGTLFFALGATSMKLPRSGAWMEVVESGLGLALVAMGTGLFLPLLPKPHALPLSTNAMLFIGALVRYAAVLLGALSLSFHGDRRERAFKGAGLALLLGAIAFRLGWLGGPVAPQIPWLHSEQAALAAARASGKPILVDFFAEWWTPARARRAHLLRSRGAARDHRAVRPAQD